MAEALEEMRTCDEETALLLHEVAEIDFAAGRLLEAKHMALAAVRLAPSRGQYQATLLLIEGAIRRV